MREKINRLAKGIVDAEVPEILILPETCEGTVTLWLLCERSGIFLSSVCAGAGKFFRGKTEPYLL